MFENVPAALGGDTFFVEANVTFWLGFVVVFRLVKFIKRIRNERP